MKDGLIKYKLMDFYLNVLYTLRDPSVPSVTYVFNVQEIKDKSDGDFQQTFKGQPLLSVFEIEKILSEIEKCGHINNSHTSRPDYHITDSGIDFKAENGSYTAQYLNRKQIAARDEKVEKADRLNKLLAPYLAIATLVLGCFTAYLTYASIQQNKDIDQLNKDRDELKARIEVLEKDHQQRQIESKLKLPIRK